MIKIIREVLRDTLFRLSKPREREIQNFKMFINTREPSYTMRKTLRYYDEVKAHEPATTELFKKIVMRGDTVLDIGANIGYFSLLARTLVNAVGNVYSYEPELKNFKYLQDNIRVNKFNITANQRACSDKDGQIELNTCPYDSGHHTIKQSGGITEYRKRSMLRFFTGNKINKYQVPTTRLDNIFKGEVDVIKIDVEGSELEVLKGIQGIMDRNRELKIVLEFFPLLLKQMGTNLEELFRFIQDNNFNIFIIPDDYSAKGEMVKVGEYKELMKYCPNREDHVNLYLTRNNYV